MGQRKYKYQATESRVTEVHLGNNRDFAVVEHRLDYEGNKSDLGQDYIMKALDCWTKALIWFSFRKIIGDIRKVDLLLKSDSN